MIVMKKYVFLFLLGLLLLGWLGSCVDPYPFTPPNPDDILVVDGYITDQDELYEVRLTTAAAYGNVIDTNNYNYPVEDALVILLDDQGERTTLIHQPSEPGTYRTSTTSGFKGEIGRSYHIEIRWDDEIYFSRPEQIPESSPVDTIVAELIRDFVPNERGIETEYCYYDLRVNMRDPKDVVNQYLWKYRYIYEFKNAFNISTGDPCFVRKKGVGQFGLANDAFIDGNSILNYSIGKMEYNFWHIKFLIDVEQHHITPEAYRFWEQIEQQQKSVGSVFDPPPAGLPSNIYCSTDSSVEVFGYFRASSVTTNYTFFSRPVSACTIDTLSLTRCSQIRNSSNIYPPDPRWR